MENINQNILESAEISMLQALFLVHSKGMEAIGVIEAVVYSWQDFLHQSRYHPWYTRILLFIFFNCTNSFHGHIYFPLLFPVYLCVVALKSCTLKQNGREKVKLLGRCFLKSCKVRIYLKSAFATNRDHCNWTWKVYICHKEVSFSDGYVANT